MAESTLAKWFRRRQEHSDSRQQIAELERELAVLRRSAKPDTAAHESEKMPMFAGEALTGLITDYSSDLISIHSPDGEFVYVSPNCERFFGWRRAELLGTNRIELIHEDDRPGMAEANSEPADEQDDLQMRYRIRSRTGEYHWVETRSRETEDGRYAVCMTRDVHSEMLNEQSRSSMSDELRRLAYTDALTGLPNRLAADERLRREFSRSYDMKQKLSAVIIDVDKFKAINDTQGHLAGDQVLQAIAAAIQSGKRDNDFAARWAGDEFIMIQPETQIDQAAHALERLRVRVAEEVEGVTLSIGVADSRGATSVDELLRRADAALYDAKDQGRNCVALYRNPE